MKVRLPKRRLYRVMLYVISIVLILVAIDLGMVRMGRHVTIGADTTYITSPLKADGYPDYHAYMEAEHSAGITAENNAAAVLVASFDPSLLPERVRERAYAATMRTMPAAGTGLKFYEAYLKEKGLGADALTAHQNDLDETHDHFWKAGDRKELAGYLAAQNMALAAFHKAAQKPRYYCPLISPDNSDLMISMFVPAVTGTRLAARVTLSQAMLDAGNGNFEKAHAEIMDVHRMAALLAQQATMVEVVSAIRMGDEASDADASLAGSGKLTGAQARQYLAEVSGLPALPTPEHAINRERLFGLDCFMYASKVGMPEALRILSSVDVEEQGPPAFVYEFVPVNFNRALRATNGFYDEMVAAGRKATYQERVDAYRAMELRAGAYARADSWDASRRLLALILPSLVVAQQRDDGQRMHLELVRIAYGLAAYRAERGEYPGSLDQIKGIVAEIPQDVFGGGALRYVKTAAGYTLYSVGPNMADDGGQNVVSHGGANERGVVSGRVVPSGPDDIVVRVPTE